MKFGGWPGHLHPIYRYSLCFTRFVRKNFTVAMWKKPFVNPQHIESGGYKITIIHSLAVVIVFLKDIKCVPK